MDIETSKNDNNLDESYEEDNFEMNSEIIEEKTTPENYSTDEYNNIIMYDSDIDDCYRSFEEDLNEESRCDKNNYENFNECDEDIDSQKEDYDEGIRCLQEKYQIPLILLTMGKEGSRAYYKGMRVECSGFSVKTIETTGAGDTLNGAFSVKIANGADIKTALTFANTAASLSTEKFGAQTGMPTVSEVEKELQ